MTYRDKDGNTVDLIDDGSLDTVLLVNGSDEVRFSDTSEHRSVCDGSLTDDGFRTLAEEALDLIVGDL